MRLLTRVVITLAVAACTAETPAPASPQEQTSLTPPAAVDANAITPQGWGPLRIGMTRAEVTAAVGATATPGAVGGSDPQACDLFHPARAPEGLLVMIQQDVLTSITLRNNTTLKSERGFGVGDTSTAIKAAYGASATSEPHKYVEGAEYITIWSVGAPSPRGWVEDPNARGVRYETNAEGVVTAVHAGGPSIQNVEGCS